MSRSRSRYDRRQFLQSGLMAAGAMALPNWFVEESAAEEKTADVKSPSERARILLVGCGGMGKGDAKNATRFGDIVAVCDVDSNRAGVAAMEFKSERKSGDFRTALEDKGIDIVINATPDHWHTLINVAALRAGKDVYSEKPLTLTINEGKTLVSVVRDTKRILQTGSQQRSDARFRLACELVRNGRFGKLKRIITTLPAGPVGGPFESKPVPPELDWEFWLGQAPKVDYVPERCHMTFRFWRDYSGGTITDWGAHHNDIAQWGNGTERSGPVTVEGKVLTSPIAGGYETPALYQVEYTYANGVSLTCKTVAHESFYGQPTRELKPGDERNGVRFEGADGWLFVTRGHIEASDSELLKSELPAGAERLYVSNDHMGNFFECVRSRKVPICEAEIGHRSVSVCHLGAIALRTGRKLSWDPEREQFSDDADANRFLSREMRAPWRLDG